MNAELFRRIAAVKMPASALREIIAILADVFPEETKCPKQSRAERNRRYYESKLSDSERLNSDAFKTPPRLNSDVLKTSYTSEIKTLPPSPPPSSPSPLHPPSPPAPAPAPVHEPAPMREEPKKERKSGSKASRISEAKATTESCTLPKDLQTEPFTEVWADWCQHRERLAAAGKPWTALAARTLLRQCADNGEAWSIKAIRNSLANGYQGVFWDQKDNPEDVRSQPMKPANRMQAELPIPRDPSKPIVYTGGRVKSPWD